MLHALKESSLADVAVGTEEYFAAQKRLILSRPLLKWCYDGWYRRMLADVRSVKGPGVVLELGSGGSYLEDLDPSIVTSDVVPGVAEKVIDGRSLPYPDRSIRALLMTHVFHHIPDVVAFLGEAQRTLIPGGVISMIEVAHTPFARFFFRNFHPEPYVDDARDWSFAQQHSMMDSNQALSWMVFVRDRRRFESLYPDLKIERFAFLPWFTYLLTGGVTGRCLAPAPLSRPLQAVEGALRPLSPLFALHWHIVVRKSAEVASSPNVLSGQGSSVAQHASR